MTKVKHIKIQYFNSIILKHLYSKNPIEICL